MKTWSFDNDELFELVRCGCKTDHLGIITPAPADRKYLIKIKKHKNKPAECVARAVKHKYAFAPWTIITRTFRDIKHKIMVNVDGTFTYKDQKFKPLSASVKEITGIKISCPDFFELYIDATY